MQTIIRTGTAQEQIDAAITNLDRVGGDASESMRERLEFYFQARIELANAMNLQRIADSLEQLLKLPKNQPVIVAADPANLNIAGAGPPVCDCGADARTVFGSDHAKSCPMWAPF